LRSNYPVRPTPDLAQGALPD
jgi:hypothetical protein